MPNLNDISGARNLIDVPFQEWIPDHPAFQNPGFPDCENALPGDLGFYRPIPRIVTVSTNSIADLVPTATRNAGQLIGLTGGFYYTAMQDPTNDQLHHFQYNEDTETWENVTPATPQGFDATDHAYYDVFGTRVYTASSVNQRIMAKDLAAGGQFAEIADAPSARDLAVIRGFLVAIHHRQGENATIVRDGVTWSGQLNPENWPDITADPIGAASVLRGRTQLVGGGELKRIIPGINGADAIIFGETKIWRMTFIGPPAVWDFQIIAHDEGTPVGTSVIASNDFIYFMGRRGWMKTNGASILPIGAGKVDRTFFDGRTLDQRFQLDASNFLDTNLGLRGAISAAPLTDHVAMWSYQSFTPESFETLQTDGLVDIETDQGDTIEVSVTSTTNDTLLIYNELTGRWGNAKLALPAIGRAETVRTRADNARQVALNTDLELVTFSSTSILDAFFISSETIGSVNHRLTLRRVWPFVDSENCTIRLLAKERFNDAADTSPSGRVQEDDGGIPIHESGRFVSVRLDLPASDQWSALIGMSAEFADQGLGTVA